MDSTITITLGQLFNFLFALLGIALLIILFILLYKIYETLKQVKEILTQNEENIDETLERIPKVLHNIEEISGVVNEEVKNFQGVVRNIEETVEYTASAAQGINEDILEPIRDIFQILSLIGEVFPRKKKKSWFKK
ncbi:hypothetical protein CACET_c06590 [Clostridium aceticum]|uniref:Uncharacterized protein n=1 Tax=Clostridium aceticum TaxID=84022 RepID=A0A0D8IDY4_9CLOT|nr:hypothetical protein [Clostridium aceticum]AKL94169.1 hypothetical protein CACET_c06590 [Clostridium aceticum]KJF28488.1 hypothetical protein TZ02_00730 [Clostridium aceticum]